MTPMAGRALTSLLLVEGGLRSTWVALAPTFIRGAPRPFLSWPSMALVGLGSLQPQRLCYTSNLTCRDAGSEESSGDGLN